MDNKDLLNIKEAYLEVVGNHQLDEEGMTIKDFKKNRNKLKQRENRSDARTRGHVSKDSWTKGETYDTDSAKRRRSNLTPETRATRHSARRNPDEYDSSVMQRDYSGTITKNAKKLRKQKAMGEFGEQIDIYDIILSHLLDEGYAETVESAEAIMVNMSEEWREDILQQLDEISLKLAKKATRERENRMHKSYDIDFDDAVKTGNPPEYSDITKKHLNQWKKNKQYVDKKKVN